MQVFNFCRRGAETMKYPSRYCKGIKKPLKSRRNSGVSELLKFHSRSSRPPGWVRCRKTPALCSKSVGRTGGSATAAGPMGESRRGERLQTEPGVAAPAVLRRSPLQLRFPHLVDSFRGGWRHIVVLGELAVPRKEALPRARWNTAPPR